MPAVSVEYPDQVVHGAIQECLDNVAFGLAWVQERQTRTIDVSDPPFWLKSSEDHKRTPEELANGFRSWILGNGFRDAIESISPALLQCFRISKLWQLPGKASLKPDGRHHLEPADKIRAQDILGNQSRKFERKSLPDKIACLGSECGIPKPSRYQDLLGLVAARNCLVHRSGLVGAQDTTDDQGENLVVGWQAMAVGKGEGSSDFTEHNLPFVLEPDEVLTYHHIERGKEFPLGQLVEFSTKEFTEICYSLLVMSHEMYYSCMEIQDRRLL